MCFEEFYIIRSLRLNDYFSTARRVALRWRTQGREGCPGYNLCRYSILRKKKKKEKKNVVRVHDHYVCRERWKNVVQREFYVHRLMNYPCTCARCVSHV